VTSSKRQLLAIDVGAGTQDILLYDADKPLENCYQLVLPSQTTIAAKRIQKATGAGMDIFLHGSLMGGGPCVSAMKNHLRAGLRVFATPSAAKTVRDNPDEVRAFGVQIVDEQPPRTHPIQTGDLDIPALHETLSLFELELPALFAVAVQDHGETITESQRRFRFRHWEQFMEGGGNLDELAYSEIPCHLTRMRAVQEQAPGALLMDTGPAAIVGALQDPVAASHQAQGLVVVNLGNQHTIAFLVRGETVYGVLEHHTVILNPQKLEDFIGRFRAGTLSNEEVLTDNGHGCHVRADYGSEEPFAPVVVTGPNRNMAAGTGWHTAAPHGDMMMTGPFGLVAAARRLGLVE
jgi:uncharacterized protein (DUF1786 family)